MRKAWEVRWRWGRAGLVLLLLLLLTMLMAWVGRWLLGPASMVADVPALSQGAEPAAVETGQSARVPGSAAPASATPRAAAPSAAPGDWVRMVVGDGEVTVPAEGMTFCGARRVSVDELKRWVADRAHGRRQVERLNEQMLAAGKTGLARLSARLATGSERQQVAARLLMRDLDGAAALAERSRDVQAYRMAFSACRGMGGSGAGPACARLSAQRWAELDPSDARPWLRLMREAHLRNDQAALAAALAEAASRPRWSRASSSLEGEVMASADAAPDPGELGNALLLTIGFDAAMDDTWDVTVLSSRACKGDALSDPTRLSHCRTLARQILANTRDILEAQSAQALADRVGVPREQQAHDAATLQAAAARFHQQMPDLNPTCESLQDMRRFSAERAASGDLGMALSALRASQPAR